MNGFEDLEEEMLDDGQASSESYMRQSFYGGLSNRQESAEFEDEEMLVDDPVANWCQKNLIDDDEASDEDDDMDEDQGMVSVSYRVA